MRRNNRFIGTATITAALVALTAAVCTHAQPFKAVRQLTSNNIVALAGSGDTLWMATERGFNYRTSTNVEGGWLGFEVNDLAYRFWGLGFGGGVAAALINKDNQSDSIGFWRFKYGDNSQRQKFFKFKSDISGDSAKPVGGIVYSNGNFWAPFNHGGLVRYDPADNSVYAVRPEGVESLPQSLGELTSDDIGAKAVLSLDVNPIDGSIIVTTPKTLWRYHPRDKRWESINTNPTLVDTTDYPVSFDAAFIIPKKTDANANVNTGEVPTLYSFITIRRNGENDTTRLYAFDTLLARWRIAVNKIGRYSIFPAVNGCMYTLFENRVSVYVDTASVWQGGALSELMNPDTFLAKLRNPNPTFNDILFLPKTASTGTLAVATETGLYICDSVAPLSNKYAAFTLHRYVRSVSPGEVYALPGIIRGGMDGRYEKCVFVYKLSKDGDVTIRVYDYNMSLVKTVVKGERRTAADRSRSTEPNRDFWDGTNEKGKRVWPGVYYFKITTNAGERLFGKVILAK
ncbi:MAG: hypothetical protein LBC59_01420 [Chitinispirillales bacterium]|jgi:hypothetical protein|nr:hypothetical protein [Chitinispirillales bacterium]